MGKICLKLPSKGSKNDAERHLIQAYLATNYSFSLPQPGNFCKCCAAKLTLLHKYFQRRFWAPKIIIVEFAWLFRLREKKCPGASPVARFLRGGAQPFHFHQGRPV
jgi:hypothetical protein